MAPASMNRLAVFYCDAGHSDKWLDDKRLLALIRFGSSPPSVADPRICTVDLKELGAPPTAEIWLGAHSVQTSAAAGIYHADDGEVLFLQSRLEESAPEALQAHTVALYQRLLATAHALGYPHLLRIWNYFPNINQECAGLERYRAFCAGRHQALMAELRTFEASLPAASALGTHGSGLQVYALAARHPGVQIENPRQMSAFHYPPQYGRRSPSFSRAVLKNWSEQQLHLYISGTASIVGHTSLHQDLLSQLDETLSNLEILLAETSRRTAAGFAMTLLKIYLRSALDPAPVRERIARKFGENLPLLFLHADICRRELLIEIEGLATATAAPYSQEPCS